MQFVPVYNTAKIEIGHTLFGLYYQHNLYFFQYGAVWDAPRLLNLAGNVGTYYINRILPHLSRDVNLLRITASNAEIQDQPSITIPYSSFYGGYDDTSLPIHVCMYMQLRTQLRAPLPTFHLCLSGIPQTLVNANSVDTTWYRSLADDWTALLDAPMPLSADWSVVSFKEGGNLRSEGDVRLVARALSDNPYTSQRRGRLKNIVI